MSKKCLEKLASINMLQDDILTLQRITLVYIGKYAAECGPTKAAHQFSMLKRFVPRLLYLVSKSAN